MKIEYLRHDPETSIQAYLEALSNARNIKEYSSKDSTEERDTE